MTTVVCTKCQYAFAQDETWDEKAEEHFLATGHAVYRTDLHQGTDLGWEADL